jgi:hypothetical protein
MRSCLTTSSHITHRTSSSDTGALAALTYGMGQLSGCEGAEELFVQLHSGVLGPYWAQGRELVDAQYAGEALGG